MDVAEQPFWVGITDRDWYEFLAAGSLDEVNFWQPSGRTAFRALAPGGLFLFKLHSPDNFIVGGGHFVRHSALPASLAWEAFGEKNGVRSFDALIQRIRKYRGADADRHTIVGCNVLVEPFFLKQDEWIPAPRSWAPNIVRGKTFSPAEPEGAALLDAVRARLLERRGFHGSLPALEAAFAERYGAEYLERARLGQGAFRVLVTDSYHRRCAVTGERTLPALEAAHIKPYADCGPHLVSNGLLLRSDLHRLFDEGYLTVTSELRVEVSPRIKVEFQNGRDYYRYHGAALAALPDESWARPSPEFIDWHNERVYRA